MYLKCVTKELFATLSCKVGFNSSIIWCIGGDIGTSYVGMEPGLGIKGAALLLVVCATSASGFAI